MRSRLAWVLATLATVAVVCDAVVTAQYRSLLSEDAVAVHGFPFISGAAAGSAVLGALIVARDDRHVIGWLLTTVGTAGAVSLLTESFSIWVLSHDGPGSPALGGVAGWVAVLLGGELAITGLVLLFLLAPDGRLLSRRWRYVAATACVGELLCFLAVASQDPRTFDLSGSAADVLGPARQVVSAVGFLLITGSLFASLAAMVVRLRGSQGEQRQQLRLVALAALCVCVGLAWLLVGQTLNGGRQTWAAQLPLFVAYLLLPVWFAVAAQRYRLYDIEVILNRTVVLAVVTAFAAGGYTALVVLAGHVVGQRTDGAWLSLFATVVVALAFQPLRRTVVRLADRLAFGARAQPYRELAQLSRRLSQTPSAAAAGSTETLLSVVAEAAGRAVSARRATATLAGTGLSASWGEDRTDRAAEHVVPVRSGGVALGDITVAVPRGRPLRAADVRLLGVLADQAAVAFRNVAMEAELGRRVAELDRTTSDLAASRSRVVEADDAVRRTLSAAIARDVLPHLSAVSDGLAQPRPDGPPVPLAALVARVNTALHCLRDLTRGVFPAQLARAGLEPALHTHLARDGRLDQTLEVRRSAAGRRFATRVETAVYFCCTQALAAGAGPTSVVLDVVGGSLVHTVRGIAPAALDLQGVRDRVEAAGGSVRVEADLLRLSIPLLPDPVEVEPVGAAAAALP